MNKRRVVMKQFELTMMCSSCKWKITDELKRNGFMNFDIDMTSSRLIFEQDVNALVIIKIVNRIGYKIEPIDEELELSDDDLAMIEDAIRNGYDF
jgi:hypothetical protein